MAILSIITAISNDSFRLFRKFTGDQLSIEVQRVDVGNVTSREFVLDLIFFLLNITVQFLYCMLVFADLI